MKQMKLFIVDFKMDSELNSVPQNSPVFTPRRKFSFELLLVRGTEPPLTTQSKLQRCPLFSLFSTSFLTGLPDLFLLGPIAAHPQFSLDTCQLRYVSATPAELIGFTLVYVQTSTRCVSVPSQLLQSGVLQHKYAGLLFLADARAQRSNSAEFST